jgi:hypothetical protein
MDRYEEAARLEWWANRHTCLGSFDVRVTVLHDASGWHASAVFASPLSEEDREGWGFLMELSPYFTLRFEGDDQAAIDVRVDESEDGALTVSTV